MAADPKKRDVVTVDPDIWMDRMLYYNEKHSGWVIFKSVYWAMYLLLVGGFLIFYTSANIPPQTIAGISVVILAIMIIIYGFAQALHYKFMKRYG
jgi:hypothetical protein